MGVFEDRPKVYALRLQAGLFGYNAQKYNTLPISLRIGEINPKDWSFVDGPYATRSDANWPNKIIDPINLDSIYGQIVVDSWIVLKDPNKTMLYLINGIAEVIKSDYGLTAKTTELNLDLRPYNGTYGDFSPVSTVVYAQSEELELAEQQLANPVEGNEIVPYRIANGLKCNQRIIISGKRIRAKIDWIPDQNPAKLESDDDPTKFRMLEKGEELIVLEPPFDIPHSFLQKWHLMDKNCFNGLLYAIWPGNIPKTYVGPYVFSWPAFRLAFGDYSIPSVPRLPVSS
jgi:hypothetical protein